MKDNFADIVESMARFQFRSEGAMARLDRIEEQVLAVDGVSVEDKHYMLSLIIELKITVTQRIDINEVCTIMNNL